MNVLSVDSNYKNYLINLEKKEEKVQDVSQIQIEEHFNGNYPFTSLMTKELIHTKTEYNLSKHWKITKINYIRRYTDFNRDNKKCEVCGMKVALQVHHLSYGNVGAETQKDLILLCYKCHSKAHNKIPEKSGLEHKKKRRSIFKNMEHKELNLQDYLTFGKYKNKLVSEVVELDKNYIKWCIDQNVCKFSDEICV